MTAARTSETQPEPCWPALSRLVADTLGLHFPPERYADLRRGFLPAARELGFDDPAECARRLLAQPGHRGGIQALASHLTVGETYFFRDRPALDALAGEILPPLIRQRRDLGQRYLRLWSAACCTGEEAYTLAILLHRLLPDPQDWRITVAATDVNPRFLDKARAGRYGDWSFRDAPDWLRRDYFRRGADGSHAVIPEIRAMVRFVRLNLADGDPAWDDVDAGEMDVIFCRNTLMYFTPAQMARVVARFHRRLAPGGWLAVSPGEASTALFPGYAPVYFPDAILFRKAQAKKGCEVRIRTDASDVGSDAASAAGDSPHREAPGPTPGAKTQPHPRAAGSDAAVRAGRRREARASTAAPGAPAGSPQALARALADRGRLDEAQAWCERWLAEDKLDPAAHYLHAVILIERGEAGRARASLRGAVYLDGGFVLAHFALGNLARARGDEAEARACFAEARRLLRAHPPDALLPHSDGLTAGRLADTLRGAADGEQAA